MAEPADTTRGVTALYVSGLQPSTPVEDVQKLFSSVGPVRRCFLVTKPGSTEGTGFAFVHYALSADAQAAVARFNGKKDILGVKKKLRVEAARPRQRGASAVSTGSEPVQSGPTVGTAKQTTKGAAKEPSKDAETARNRKRSLADQQRGDTATKRARSVSSAAPVNATADTAAPAADAELRRLAASTVVLYPIDCSARPAAAMRSQLLQRARAAAGGEFVRRVQYPVRIPIYRRSDNWSLSRNRPVPANGGERSKDPIETSKESDLVVQDVSENNRSCDKRVQIPPLTRTAFVEYSSASAAALGAAALTELRDGEVQEKKTVKKKMKKTSEISREQKLGLTAAVLASVRYKSWRLIVRNIAFHATEELLRAKFVRVGPLLYAFREHADAALSTFNGSHIAGRLVAVDFAASQAEFERSLGDASVGEDQRKNEKEGEEEEGADEVDEEDEEEEDDEDEEEEEEEDEDVQGEQERDEEEDDDDEEAKEDESKGAGGGGGAGESTASALAGGEILETELARAGAAAGEPSRAVLSALTLEEEEKARRDEAFAALSEAELRGLEAENLLLENEFATVSDQIRETSQRVADVSVLQQVFAEKVLEQAQELDSVYETAEHSVETMRRAELELVTASKRGLAFRYYVAIALVGAALALLFLDWVG